MTFEKSKKFGAALEEVVPGGAHTYSKGRDQFPLEAPNGITHGKGALIWDQDGNELIDWGMGLTSVSIGHAYDPVDDAVCEAIRKGVNFPRPAALELEAAEVLRQAVGRPNAMVKFAKHGSTVTTAAVKLARAFTGKTKVACPAEHPFFSFDDWFISTTPVDFGIPDFVRDFTIRFRYGDIRDLEGVFREHGDDIACIIMEPMKFDRPPRGYLREVKDLCHRNGALFIVDEMVSGFKWAMGGGQEVFEVEGDLSTWGKGIANGYAASALIGRPDIMRLGGIDEDRADERKLFLMSTTHGAESSGLAAMMATVKAFREGDMIARNWDLGRSLKAALGGVIDELGLKDAMRLTGDPCLFVLETFDGEGKPDLDLRTLWMQEMIAGGVCTQGLFMPTASHGPDIVARTVRAFRDAATVYGEALSGGGMVERLKGSAIKPVFRPRV